MNENNWLGLLYMTAIVCFTVMVSKGCAIEHQETMARIERQCPVQAKP